MNAIRFAWLAVCVGFTSQVAAGNVLGQAPNNEAAEAAWRELYLSEAKALRLLAVDGADKRSLTLHDKPVMRWVSFNGFNGDVFVWLNQGRPAVVGNIVGFPADGLKENQRYTLAELHSLSASPIEAEPTDDNQVWKTRSGISRLRIPKLPPPGKSERERKRQMREIARDFTGWLSHYGEKWQLRMLDKPLYEYEAPMSDVVCGAIFALVAFRTDPELLLLVEARAGTEGPQWEYLPVRLSQQDLWLKYRDAQVWESLVGPRGDVQPKAESSQYRVYDNKLQTLPEQ